jgi:hypothetical protein
MMKWTEKLFRIGILVLFLVVVFVLHTLLLRSYTSTKGSTPEEISASMPGDSIVAAPDYVSTHAITIDARPREVFPWLMQMGLGKAGFYNYDWLNNRFRLSSQVIMDEYQSLSVGDTIRMSMISRFKVDTLVKDAFMVWTSNGNNPTETWTWVLVPEGIRSTRLILRQRIDYNYLSPLILVNYTSEVMNFMNTRETLSGIKKRAEMDVVRKFTFDLANGLFLLIPILALFIFGARVLHKKKWWEPIIMMFVMVIITKVSFIIDMPLWLRTIIAFIVLLTLIGTAAETAAAKKDGVYEG